MPNQKSSKGKKSKRTNSSGDEQENGACAAATGGAAAAAAPRSERSSEAQCATPLGCSLSRAIDLEKDDCQRVVCNSELCPYGNWMHLQCFYEWESSILVQFNCIGRARSWNEKQCRQNMWTKKGYDLAFRFCSCRCGQGHLKKDTDWYQVKRMQDERKKKSSERSSGRTGASGGASGSGDGFFEEPKKSKPLGGAVGGAKLANRASSQEMPRRQSVDRQNSTERGGAAGGGGYAIGGPLPFGPPQKSPCDSPGQSPPTGFTFSPTAALGSGGGGTGMRGSRQLGEFFKSAVHMDAQRKHLLVGGSLGRSGGCSLGASGGAAGAPHLDAGSVLPLQLSFTLPLHHRLTSGSVGDGSHPHPVQFLRRLDLSELLTHIPRHKLNTYHVRMEDDAQAGQGEELRRFILSALSASQRNVVNCALCHRALPVFEQFPLVDGTLFLSPSRHDEIEYDVPCHLQGRLMHLYAICVDCLEGVHKIVCIKCKSRWDGSWHQLGTMYTYDILAASPCCQARLNCKHCGKPVVDVRVGMQYFSEYSNVQQCPHCGNLDYHFVKPFSSYKVLEAY
ncbi:headcase protein homolog [Maylandia zebra]|uniref:Hdc homolog, cell cycle regulator n=2 Tax=Haplochromini TaxID=319058 RepID=A0A3Q3BZT1_HAPBU|nr:headcase protein homolog isoform X1 [Maylandia zebra]XP_005931599.1 headcase protein homolog [Haplochromis burtoni]